MGTAGILTSATRGASLPFAALPCWTAAELYGSWEDTRTLAARLYMFSEAPAWLHRNYLRFGERIAQAMHRWRPVRWAMGPLVSYWTRRGMRQARRAYKELC